MSFLLYQHLYRYLEVKPYGRDGEIFWYKTEIKIISFMRELLLAVKNKFFDDYAIYSFW